MGTTAKKIVKCDVKELIDLMNKALADEWLAYYQYWVGAKIVEGPMMNQVKAELEEHANEELKHANMLVERILMLGGTPVLNPNKWEKICNCKYAEPTKFDAASLLKQNIEGERCAIAVYEKLIKLTEGKDPISFFMFLEILKEELEHEDDLENLLKAIP